jgi:hypothetical protein
MPSRTRLVSLGLLAGAVLVSPALAGPLDMTFMGDGMHAQVTVWHSGFVSAANPAGSTRITAGEKVWTIVPAGTSVGSASEHRLFSVGFNVPSSGTATLRAIADLLDGGGGFGKAGMLENLYTVAAHQSSLSDLHAAAFQVAIWEIVYERAFDSAATTFNQSGLDAANGIVELGGFAVGSGPTGARDPVASKANQWLVAAWSRWFDGHAGKPLSVTDDPGGGGGQILESIPLPTASAMALVGLACIGAHRRRRR